jgi:hypothetical protein
VREHEFATLDVPAKPAPVKAAAFAGAKVEKLADGFASASGATLDSQGRLFFIDRPTHRIHGWTPERGLWIERDAPLDPVNLAADRSGNLMVLSSDGRDGSVYSFKPGSPDTELTRIAATPVVAHPGGQTLLPVGFWVNGEFRDQIDPATYRFTTLAEMFARDMAVPKAREYVSADGSVALPAFRVFQQGPADFRGFRFSDALDTYGFITGTPGSRVFVTNQSENKTYSGLLGAGGTLTDLKPFANRGGEGVAVDAQGRVFVANGQVFVYAPDGRELGQIDIPERPLQLVFGADRRTLYVLTHHALYGVRM